MIVIFVFAGDDDDDENADQLVTTSTSEGTNDTAAPSDAEDDSTSEDLPAVEPQVEDEPEVEEPPGIVEEAPDEVAEPEIEEEIPLPDLLSWLIEKPITIVDLSAIQYPGGPVAAPDDPSLITTSVAVDHVGADRAQELADFLVQTMQPDSGVKLYGRYDEIRPEYYVIDSHLLTGSPVSVGDYQSSLFGSAEVTDPGPHNDETPGSFERIANPNRAWFLDHTSGALTHYDTTNGFAPLETKTFVAFGNGHATWFVPIEEMAEVEAAFVSQFVRITEEPPATENDPAGYALVERAILLHP